VRLVTRQPSSSRVQPIYPNPLRSHARRSIWTGNGFFAAWANQVDVFSVKTKLAAHSKQHSAIFACQCAHQEEDNVVRGIMIVLAITGALAVSGIVAPAPAQAGRLASTPYGCDPSGGPYRGYAQPSAYAAYYYGYPPDCGGLSISFYFAPGYYGYRYSGPPYTYRWYHGRHRRQ